jgi:hypothetical protein
MYSAYFDDSGHPDSSRYVVAAGCIADVKQWEHIEREWKDALAPLGVTVFHASDFENDRAPFNALTERQKDVLISKLSAIIRLRVEKTFSATIDMCQYRPINRKYVFAEYQGYPYPHALRHCMGYVKEWTDSHAIPITDVKFFVESGAKHSPQIEWIAERDRFPIPEPKEKSNVPLQTADLLAWCHHLYQRSSRNVKDRYLLALQKLQNASSAWGIVDMADPDRLPTIYGVPVRDQSLRYQSKVIRVDGRRRPVVESRSSNKLGSDRIKRGCLVLPEIPLLSPSDLSKRIAAYDRRHKL